LVFLGNGDGTFSSPQSYYAGAASGLGVGDFNGDGKLDLAVSGDAGVAILFGNGDGTFQIPTFVGSGAYYHLRVADLNNDGNSDFSGDTGFDWEIFLGNRDGTFRALSPISISSDLYPMVAIADVNGDGKPDLIWNGLSFSLGNGDGTFGTPTTSIGIAGTVLTADLNGDGRPDLTVLTGAWLTFGFNTTAPDFTIGPAAGSKTSVTVSAGKGATYDLAISSLGWFSGTANLTCSITPTVTPPPTCSLPGSVSVAKYGTTPFQLKAGTTAPGTMGMTTQPGLPPSSAPLFWTALLACGLLGLLSRRRHVVAPALLAFALMCAGCGGGSSPGSSPPPQMSAGTPAGTYTITVTAKSGSLQHDTTVTLIVQ